MRKSYKNMEKKVEVKNKKKLGLLMVFLMASLSGGLFVFAEYLFSDFDGSTTEVYGIDPNQNVSISDNFEDSTIIQTDSTSNITLIEEKEYIFYENMTLNFYPNVTKVLLDQQCVDWEDDCDVKFYLKKFDQGVWWEFNVSQYFTNPFIFAGKTGNWNPEIDGKNTIRMEMQCVPTVCHQTISKYFNLTQ